MKKICQYCGKEFETLVRNKKYCSDTCREKCYHENDIKKNGGKYEKICLICGKTFFTNKAKVKTCSRSCASKYSYGARQKTVRRNKTTRLKIAMDKLKNGENLTAFDIAALALNEGLSYGQYVSLHKLS